MIHRTSLLLGVLILLAVSMPAFAAGPKSDDAPTIYRLEEGSTLQRGCFPPCLCPIMMEQPVYGTYTLKHVEDNPLFSVYAVNDVSWFTTIGGKEVHITGQGKYLVGGEVALTQRLQLDLKIGDEPSAHFDSGWVPGSNFPAINITISINGMYCFDTVIAIASKPVPADQITRYKLSPDSTYVEGCFDPCMCPIWLAPPLQGTFTLVPILNGGTYREYAVLDVHWTTSFNGGSSDILLQGSGVYTHIDGFAGPMHQLELDLSKNGSEPIHFDSGLLNGGEEFPIIAISVSMNNMYCYDIVLGIHAIPQRRAPAQPTLSPAASNLTRP